MPESAQQNKTNDEPKRTWHWGYKLAIAIGALTALWGVGFLLMDLDLKTPFSPGVTFSAPYAKELGLDPDQALAAALDDLQVRNFRIPAYWDQIQTTQSSWDWTVLDKQLDAIAERGGKVTLAVGQKLPRWPECWIPAWALKLPEAERESALKNYLTQTVNRYKNHPAVNMWQVENEAHFAFGICPSYRSGLLDEELALVRSLDDSKPVATTDSGELSLWLVGKKVDRLGSSVYRVVVGPLGILRYWFVPPQAYLRKAQILNATMGVKDVYVSEFQMEPWVKATIPSSTLAEQAKTMDLDQFRKNAAFAKRMGIERVDFWGVEWWYWMKTVNNNPDMWNEAKSIFAKP